MFIFCYSMEGFDVVSFRKYSNFPVQSTGSSHLTIGHFMSAPSYNGPPKSYLWPGSGVLTAARIHSCGHIIAFQALCNLAHLYRLSCSYDWFKRVVFWPFQLVSRPKKTPSIRIHGFTLWSPQKKMKNWVWPPGYLDLQLSWLMTEILGFVTVVSQRLLIQFWYSQIVSLSSTNHTQSYLFDWLIDQLNLYAVYFTV